MINRRAGVSHRIRTSFFRRPLSGREETPRVHFISLGRSLVGMFEIGLVLEGTAEDAVLGFLARKGREGGAGETGKGDTIGMPDPISSGSQGCR